MEKAFTCVIYNLFWNIVYENIVCKKCIKFTVDYDDSSVSFVFNCCSSRPSQCVRRSEWRRFYLLLRLFWNIMYENIVWKKFFKFAVDCDDSSTSFVINICSFPSQSSVSTAFFRVLSKVNWDGIYLLFTIYFGIFFMEIMLWKNALNLLQIVMIFQFVEQIHFGENYGLKIIIWK